MLCAPFNQFRPANENRRGRGAVATDQLVAEQYASDIIFVNYPWMYVAMDSSRPESSIGSKRATHRSDRLFRIDIAEVQTAELYLFVAIDRASSFAFARLVESAMRPANFLGLASLGPENFAEPVPIAAPVPPRTSILL